MKPYQEEYTKRGIPLFNPAKCSPYAPDSMPQEGWYWIEPSGEVPMADPRHPDADEKVTELIDEEAIREMCEHYDATAKGGMGEMINEEHLAYRTTTANPAAGWVKALDWGMHPTLGIPYMAGYLSMTPRGYDLARDYYWAWSTEYLRAEYRERGDGKWSPTRLRGLALTNNPDHANQSAIVLSDGMVVHNATSPIHTTMKKKINNTRVLHSEGAEDEKDKKLNSEAAEEEQKQTEGEEKQINSDSDQKDEKECNSEDAGGWLGIANAIAEELGLGAEASGDDIVAAVKTLKADYDTLKSAVPAANTQTHSRPAPRLLHSRGRERMDKQVQPAPGKSVRTPDGKAITVKQQEVDLVKHCQAAVEKRMSALGRELTPSEFNTAWSRAANDYHNR